MRSPPTSWPRTDGCARATAIHALCGAALALCAPSSAVAQAPPTPPREDDTTAHPSARDGAAAAAVERGLLELFVNGRRSDVTIVLWSGEELMVPLDALREAGLVRLRGPSEMHDGVTYVVLSRIPDHLEYAVDMNDLSLRIDASPSLFEPSTHDLSPSAPEGMRHVSDPGAFVNYAPRLVDLTSFEGYGEVGITTGSGLLLGTVSHDPSHGVVRLVSQLVIDERESVRRTTFGDSLVSSGVLGGGAMLGGISVASNMELDPYRPRLPGLGFTGGVTSPSTLDVYVNDALVRRVPLAPGEFRVSNLPRVTGAGSTRYVIRDAMGREQRVDSDYYGAGGVLAAGLSEYAYSAGVVREEFGTESFQYGGPAFIARHRHGLTNAVTAGTRLEVDTEQSSGGVGVTLAPGLGELQLAMGASATWDGYTGGAWLVGYSYRSRRLSLGTTLRLASPRYTTVSLAASDDRYSAEHTSSAGLSFSSWGSVAARVSYALARDHEEADIVVGADASARLGAGVTLTLRGANGRRAGGSWEQEVTAMLRFSLPERHSFSTGARVTSEGAAEASAQLSRPIVGVTGVGYQVGGTVGTAERAQATVRARTSYGALDATYTNLEGDQHTLLRGSVGISVIPGEGVFLSDRVSDSSAVVHVPGVGRARTYLNNQEIGLTDANGRLFVPGLRAYEANRLRIEATDVPMHFQLDDHEQIIAPAHRGTARVTFDTRRIQLVRGRVAIGLGADERWARHGDFEVAAGPDAQTSPLGMNGEFELDGVPPGEWPAVVRSPEGRCELVLRVPERDGLIIDLGIVRCDEPARETAR